MSARSLRGLVLLTLSGSACVYRPPVRPPTGIVPQVSELASTAYGAWVIAQRADSTWESGELIAADNDSIHVLTVAGLASHAATAIKVVHVLTHQSNYGQIGAWTALGVASTLSHGFVLILSAPVWTITGLASRASASRAGVIVAHETQALQPWARFPRGIPSTVDRSRLRLRTQASSSDPDR